MENISFFYLVSSGSLLLMAIFTTAPSFAYTIGSKLAPSPKTVSNSEGITASEDRTAALAARKAARDAEFALKQKQYEEREAKRLLLIAENEAEYQAAQQQVERDKESQAARAKAAQEEFARKEAVYQAELEKHRRLQEEYEAKLKAATPPPR